MLVSPLSLLRRPQWLSLPAIAILFVAFGLPIAWLFLDSLAAPNYSLAYYKAFFAQPANIRVLFQTVEISAIATAISLAIGYPVAYFIARSSRRLRMALIVLVVIPYLTSLLARTYAWIVILGDQGLINNLLRDLGIISRPLALIYNRGAVYVGMVHIMLPMMILPLVSVMMGIDRSLMSAARSMGARPFAAFWRVFMPLSLPGVRSGCLLVFVLCLGFYITPASLGGLKDAMLSTFIAAQATSSFDMARTAAAAFVLLGIALLVLALFGADLGSAAGPGGTAPRRGLLARLLPAGLLRRIGESATPWRASRWKAELNRSGHASRIPGRLLALGAGLVITFLLFPGIVVVVMSFSGGTFLEFPPSSLSLQWYRSFFSDPSWTGAAWTSVRIAAVVALFATVIGSLAAYALSRSGPRLRGAVTLLLITPITIPVIVVGIAVYLGLVQFNLIGTMSGIIIAHTLGAIGYAVVIVQATLANFDTRLERAAMSMRAGPMRTFRRVTLPLIFPGILGGAVFAFIHSFDEVVISSLVSGMSLRTLPLKMWENMRHQIDPTIAAVASLMMLLPVIWMVAIYVNWQIGNRAARLPDGGDNT